MDQFAAGLSGDLDPEQLDKLGLAVQEAYAQSSKTQTPRPLGVL